jgi:hypothetical protein
MPRTLSESEYTALVQRVLASAPTGLSEADFQRYIGPAMQQALGEAENTDPQPEGSALGRFVGGAAEMLNPITMATGAYQAIRHPVQTGAGAVERMGQEWQKANTAAEEGRPVEAMARAVTGSVPLVGPMIADIGEQAGSGDLAGAAGKVAGLAVPFAVEKAMTARAARRAATQAPILEQQAIDQVAQRVLAPGNPKYRGAAQHAGREILARKLTGGGRDELRQAAVEGMDDAARRVDDAVLKAGGMGAPVPAQDIISGLNQIMTDLKDSKGVALSDAAARRIAALEQRIAHVKSLAGKRGTVLYEDLKKLRDENYRIADEARGYERAGNIDMGHEGWAARETGSVIRDAFARRSPETAAANADYSFFKTLNDILDPALGRPKAQTLPPGVTGGARTTGAVTGMLTGSKAATFVMGVVVPWVKERMMDSSWQLADAHAKMRLAQAMKRGDIGLMKSAMFKIAEFGPKSTSPSGPTTEFAPAGP